MLLLDAEVGRWTNHLDLDEYGNKLKVAGSDGQNVLVIPQLKIENGQWMLSVDGGATWESLGSAQGDSFFAGIKDEEDRLILELWDGSKIELSKNRIFHLCWIRHVFRMYIPIFLMK